MAIWRRTRVQRSRDDEQASVAPRDGPGTPSAASFSHDHPTDEHSAVSLPPEPHSADLPVAPHWAEPTVATVAVPPGDTTTPLASVLPGSVEPVDTEAAAPRAAAPSVAPASTPLPGADEPADEGADRLATAKSEPDDLDAPVPTIEERRTHPLPRVIAVANQKGGVGKTTTTVNLGASLALFGYRVLVVDLDPQGNATTGLGVDGRGFQHSMYDVLLADTPMVDCIEPVGIENLFVAPATLDLAGVEQELFSVLSRELRLKRAIATVVDDYDFIFIDCPPSLGLITINAFAAASEILVPVQCEFYALEGLTQLQRIVELVQRNLNEDLEISTVVLTMYDARTRLSEDVANEVRRHFPTQTQGTVIPRTVRLSEAPSFGQPITTFDPASKGARAYKALAREVSDGAQKRAG
jgi:chromosome partitioning protein